MIEFKKYKLKELVLSANTGLDAIKRAPIVLNDTGIKCLRIQDVSQSKVFGNWGFTEVSKDNYERFALKKDEIIVARTGNTIGVNLFIGKDLKSVFNNGLIRLRINNEKCNAKYLYYNLQTDYYWSFINSIAFGTSTQPNMQIGSFLEFEIVAPDINTQTRIAAILSALDDKIELNRRTNETLEKIAETLFKKYFVEGIDEENLPEGWRMENLGDVVEITSSKRIFLNEYVPTGIPFYRGKEIIELHNGGIVSSELFISNLKYEEIKSKFQIPLKGDILLTSVGTIGTPFLVPDNKPFYFKDGNLTWFRNYTDNIDPYYLYQWLKSDIGQFSIKNITNGSTQQAITIQALKSLVILIPSKDIVSEVSIQLNTLRETIYNNMEQIIQLTTIRDLLLPKLMSGEIEVN